MYFFPVVFEVYDINGDGYISRDEMYQMLKFAVIKKSMDEDPEEGTKDLVEIVIKKLVRIGLTCQHLVFLLVTRIKMLDYKPTKTIRIGKI